jgi:outer membrane protein assembly factor BamB
MSLIKLLPCVPAVLGGLACMARADWPQFQGPNRDGVSNETVKLADSWSASGPPVLWKMEYKFGTGFGGAVIAGGTIYILDRIDDRQDVLRAVNLRTGKEEWKFAYYAPAEAKDQPDAGKYPGGYNGSRNLPTVEG